MAFNKYHVIKSALSYELANFIFNYFLLKRDAVKYMYENNITWDNGMFGTWTDQQVPNTYSHYADNVMETLLVKMLPVMAKETGLQLVPTYSYARLYKNGDILKRHKDRPSCEISTTLNLGGDDWPIYLSPNENVGPPDGKNITVASEAKGVKVDLKPGDMLVYRGVDLEHWREKFKGTECVQVFLHYNNRKTPGAKNNMFDARPHLGLPSWFKRN